MRDTSNLALYENEDNEITNITKQRKQSKLVKIAEGLPKMLMAVNR